MSSSSPEYRATQKFYKNFGEEPIEVLVKGNLQQLVLSRDVDRLVGLEGCLSGNVPGAGARAGGRRERAVRAAGEGKDGEGRVRAGHVHQRGGRTDRRTADRRDQAGRSRGQAGRNCGAQGRARARGKRRRSGEARQAGELDHARALQGGPRDAGAAVRAHRAAEPRRPELRLDAGVRLEQAGGHAEGALRLPVPEPRSGVDLGALEGRSERSASGRARSR